MEFDFQTALEAKVQCIITLRSRNVKESRLNLFLSTYGMI